MRRYRDELRVTTPILGNDFLGCELVFNSVGISTLFVHLVDGNNEGNTGGPGVLNRFFCLRHDAIICRNNEDDDICRFCSACTHGGEGRVSRRIEEGNHPLICFHVISTNVLSNATRFSNSNARTSNVVQQRRFTVVYVTHYRHNRRAELWRALLARHRFLELLLELIIGFQLDSMAKLFNDKTRRILVNHLIDRCHHTELHKLFDNNPGFNRHLLSEVAHADIFGQLYVVNNLLGWLLKSVLVLIITRASALTTASTAHSRLSRFDVTE